VDAIQLQYIYPPQEESVRATTCPALDALLLDWNVYGAYDGCAFKTGVLTCVLSVRRCVLSLYYTWVLSQLGALQPRITSAFDACHGGAGRLRLGAPLITIRVASSTQQTPPSVDHTKQTMNALRRLQVEPRRWGQAHLEPLLTLGMAYGVVMLLTALCLGACALACVRWRRHVVAYEAWGRVWSYHHALLRAPKGGRTLGVV
jgi:hypothetical protein